MWRAGCDVPCLSTLYLDKPLKAHKLMQAIARLRREFERNPAKRTALRNLKAVAVELLQTLKAEKLRIDH